MDIILSFAGIIFSFVVFFGMIWGIIKYIKACNYYYYSPLQMLDCILSVVSVLGAILGIGLSNAIRTHMLGFWGVIISVAIMIGSILAGMAIGFYLVRKVFLLTGSRKFAVVTYVIQIFIGYLGLVSAGLFLLVAYVVSKKLGDKYRI